MLATTITLRDRMFTTVKTDEMEFRLLDRRSKQQAVLAKKFVAMGIESINPSKFKEVKNIRYAKPYGGLHACVAWRRKTGFLSAWHKMLVDMKKPVEHACWIELSYRTRIFPVFDEEDYFDLMARYGDTCAGIDYEKLAEDYDVLYVDDSALYDQLGVWLVGGLVILNINAVYSWEYEKVRR